MTTTPTDTRADIEQQIAEKRRQQDRLPKHFEKRRAELGDEIDDLVDDWLAAQ